MALEPLRSNKPAPGRGWTGRPGVRASDMNGPLGPPSRGRSSCAALERALGAVSRLVAARAGGGAPRPPAADETTNSQRIGPPHERDASWQLNPAARPHPGLLLLRAAEVAAILQVSPKTVSRWATEGKLPILKTLGGHRRYPAAEIRQLAEQLQVQPTA